MPSLLDSTEVQKCDSPRHVDAKTERSHNNTRNKQRNDEHHWIEIKLRVTYEGETAGSENKSSSVYYIGKGEVER